MLATGGLGLMFRMSDRLFPYFMCGERQTCGVSWPSILNGGLV